MRNLRSFLVFGAIAIMGLTGCHNVSFAPDAEEIGSKQQDPILDPPPPTSSPLLKSGICQDKESILSCLQCENPAQPPPPAAALTKALKLAKIMKMACPIYNRSYPKDYVAPSSMEIDQHLMACTSDLYPETAMTAAQAQTMDQLLNESDDSLRRKMFEKFWYQPPYTEYFELYFGLENKEAAYVFCLDQEISGPLMTEEYITASLDWFHFDQWENNPAAQIRWQKAQQQRQQLLSCLNKPAPLPPVSTSPSVPTEKICQYQSFEGLFNLGGQNQISLLLSQGYKIAMETANSCQQLTSVPSSQDFEGLVKIAGYFCK